MLPEKNNDNFFKKLKNLVSKQRFRRRVPDNKSFNQTGQGKFQGHIFGGANRMAMSIYEQNLQANTDRVGRLRDYDLMDATPIVSTALNVHADDACSYNEEGGILLIDSDNEVIKDELEFFFNDIVNIEFNIYHWIRNLCKYGDTFLLMAIEPMKGIQGIISLPTTEIEREEAFDGDPNSIRFRWLNQIGEYYEDYQVAHMRLVGDDNYLPYGRSILESGRRSWKQVQLLEDAMLTYRVARAAEKRVFHIEVGNLPPEDIAAYLKEQRERIKTESLVDPATGEIDLRFRSTAITDDFWFAKRGDMMSTVETLPGGCFSLDTKIPLLDGRTLELKEIVKEFKTNKNLWAYSCNPKSGEFAPGKITWAGVTRKNAQVVKITLDNGKELIVTPDHKFPTQNRGEIEAKDLTLNDSLWPFIKENKSLYEENDNKNFYEFLYDNNKKEYIPTHILVTDYMRKFNKHNEGFCNESYKNDIKNVRHHRDINRFNNNPDNLVFMSWRDHWYLHSKIFNKIGNDAQKKKWKTDKKWSEKRKKQMSEASKKMWTKTGYREMMSVKLSKALKLSIQNMDKNKKNKAINDKIIENNQKMWENEEYRNKMILQNSTRWRNEEFRKRVSESISNGKRYKYDKIIEKFLVEGQKLGFDSYKLKEYFENNKEFKDYFFKLNPHAKGFDPYAALKRLGYGGYRDFREKVQNFNHKIIKIEFLDEKIDVGTLTIDGEHEFHDYHNFALDCGIYAKNSRLNDIEDVNYVTQQLITSLGVPKIYLQFDEDLGTRGSASKEDIRFARTIQRIQKIVISELNKMAILHLFALQKFDEKEITNFKLKLYNPSTIMELGKLELIEKRLDIYSRAVADPQAYSDYKAKTKILHLSDAEYKEEKERIEKDKAENQEGAFGGSEEQPQNDNPFEEDTTNDDEDSEIEKELEKDKEEFDQEPSIGRNNSIKQDSPTDFKPSSKKDFKTENLYLNKNAKKNYLKKLKNNQLSNFFNV